MVDAPDAPTADVALGLSVRWAGRPSILETLEDVDKDSEDQASQPENDAGLPAQSSTISCPMSTHAARELQDLKDFLKVIRTDWSIIPGRHGRPNIDRVLCKLQAIGVCNIWELMRRVEGNSINEDLFTAGQAVFSKETIEHFRKEKKFLNVIEHLKDKHFRQTGLFAPVPQMLAKTNRARQDRTLFASVDSLSKAHRCAADATSCSVYSAVEPKGARSLPPASESESSTSADLGFSTTDPDGSLVAEDEVEARLRRPQLRFLTTAGAGSRPHTASLRGGRSRSLPLSSCGADGRPRTAPELTSMRRQTSNSSTAAPGPRRMSAWDANNQASVESCARRRKSQSAGIFFVGPDGRFFRKTQDENIEDATSEDLMTEDALLVQLGHKLQTAAGPMQAGDRPAHWASLHSESLVNHSDSMLHEQQALDDKTRLLHAMNQEGEVSATRRSITSNIYSRILEEEKRNYKSNMDTHIDCASIKDSLTQMQHARREVQALKKEVHGVLFSEDRSLLRNFVRASTVRGSVDAASLAKGWIHAAPSCSDDLSETSEPMAKAHKPAMRRATTLSASALTRHKSLALPPSEADAMTRHKSLTSEADAMNRRKSIAHSPSAVAKRKSLSAGAARRSSAGAVTARKSLSRPKDVSA